VLHDGLFRKTMNNKFNELGYEIIPGLLSWSERRLILQHIKHADGKACSTWSKGLAAEDAFYARLASQKKIIEILTPKLGENIIHWATDIVERPPSAAHPWHCDIESCEPEGGFVSIWIGLKHTSKKSSLALISRSHNFGVTIQEVLHKNGMRRGDATDQQVLEMALPYNSEARLERCNLKNGDALVFDGRLWHGSYNQQAFFTRTALLLQFARADRPVRMFDPQRLSWPIGRLESPWPPVLVVAGNGDPAINNLC